MAEPARFHLGTVAKEGEVRCRAVADAHPSGEGGVVVLACPKYRGPAVRCRRLRQLQIIGCILALHVVQPKQLYRSSNLRLHSSFHHSTSLLTIFTYPVQILLSYYLYFFYHLVLSQYIHYGSYF